MQISTAHTLCTLLGIIASVNVRTDQPKSKMYEPLTIFLNSLLAIRITLDSIS
jgi:hypothetical protein